MRLWSRYGPALFLLTLFSLSVALGACTQKQEETQVEESQRVNLHLYDAAEVNGVENIDCTECHTQSAPEPGDTAVKESTKEVCLSCHAEQRLSLSKPAPHRIFIEGPCTTCHRAHKSEFKSQLRLEKEKLCIACHPIGPRGQTPASLHPPYEEGKCSSCHNPHGSELRPLLHTDTQDLCWTCHRNLANDFLGSAVVHLPFKEGFCLSCHDPHGSGVEPLLRNEAKQLCFGCHDEKQLKTATIAHGEHPPFRSGLCMACHLPHGSNNDSLLVVEQNRVCGRCHAGR